MRMFQSLSPFSCKTLLILFAKASLPWVDLIQETGTSAQSECKGCSNLDFGEPWVLLFGSYVCLCQTLVWTGVLGSTEALGYERRKFCLCDHCPWGRTFFLSQFWHGMTFYLQDNLSICLCDRIYILFQLFSPCMVCPREDSISSVGAQVATSSR